MLTIILTVLPMLIFYPSRRRECGVVVPHERATTPGDEKWAPALRVTPEKVPDCVFVPTALAEQALFQAQQDCQNDG